MITTDEYDAVIVCHGCESECSAGFKESYPIVRTWWDRKRCKERSKTPQYPAQITEYMTALKQCSKLAETHG